MSGGYKCLNWHTYFYSYLASGKKLATEFKLFLLFAIYGVAQTISILESPSNSRSIKIEFITQRNQQDFFAVVLNPNVIRPIPLLLLTSRPSTIFWMIIAGCINPIKAMILGWRMPHIFKKILKRLPFFADLNTSASISIKTGVVWVRASIEHFSPFAKYNCITHSMNWRSAGSCHN